jgi:hypothetical protein
MLMLMLIWLLLMLIRRMLGLLLLNQGRVSSLHCRVGPIRVLAQVVVMVP